MPSSDNARDSLALWLRERSAAVRECERKAHAALYDDADESAYRELMKKKASLLASLAGDALPLTGALPEREKARAQGRLDEFSQNAQTALRLDSVFYMSALLYPDDHQKGEPDNLEKFIASLALRA